MDTSDLVTLATGIVSTWFRSSCFSDPHWSAVLPSEFLQHNSGPGGVLRPFLCPSDIHNCSTCSKTEPQVMSNIPAERPRAVIQTVCPSELVKAANGLTPSCTLLASLCALAWGLSAHPEEGGVLFLTDGQSSQPQHFLSDI